jgi:hypothetical protein
MQSFKALGVGPTKLNVPTHKIIKIHNNVMWDYQYSTEYSHIHFNCKNI